MHRVVTSHHVHPGGEPFSQLIAIRRDTGQERFPPSGGGGLTGQSEVIRAELAQVQPV